ncbi:MAG: hypothetical protein IPK15_23985 [Verrucomicrobia bacterium]|jgi:hypothetical protein|nr:hypothetical protein [Verrucomicrobiota bacterium]
MKTETETQNVPVRAVSPLEIAREIIANVDATTCGFDEITTERLERDTAEIISRHITTI